MDKMFRVGHSGDQVSRECIARIFRAVDDIDAMSPRVPDEAREGRWNGKTGGQQPFDSIALRRFENSQSEFRRAKVDVGSPLVMDVCLCGLSLRPHGACDVHVEVPAIEITHHQMLHA
jgi:hypothetical protein